MRGLLDRLGSQRRIDVVESIGANLRALLNARQGSAPTATDFGVIDFVEVVHDLPGAVTKVQESIRDTIQLYEPRLRNITVRFVPGPDPLRLSFEVTARLADDKRRIVRFATSLEAGGRFDVT
ncbi:MAG: type VI secretion system baseplate subunit TssE [Deltaproteobacteria bacterium]|nr:type VI secretion system baseplate subunit TssE [Deltaproteobacteria bacterium]